MDITDPAGYGPIRYLGYILYLYVLHAYFHVAY